MRIRNSLATTGPVALVALGLLATPGVSQQPGYPPRQASPYPAAQPPAGGGRQVTPYPAYGSNQPGSYAPRGGTAQARPTSPYTQPGPAAGQPSGQRYPAQSPQPQPARPGHPAAAQPPQPAQARPLTEQEIDRMIATRPGEHPLGPALRWTRSQKAKLEAVRDYTAVLIKQERVDGELGEQQVLYLKVRHEPFSVYLSFLAPEEEKGQEVIYIEGQNNGEMWAHGTGMKRAVGTLSLSPTGMVAMRGQRYPITEIGLLNLVTRLGQVAQHDAQYGECNVQFYKNATLGDRPCVCIQVVHPIPRREFRFHLARIYVDRELNLPIRYESYGWPEKANEAPPLLEQYTYTNLKFNAGLTDADFDTRNPNYQFP